MKSSRVKKRNVKYGKIIFLALISIFVFIGYFLYVNFFLVGSEATGRCPKGSIKMNSRKCAGLGGRIVKEIDDKKVCCEFRISNNQARGECELNGGRCYQKGCYDLGNYQDVFANGKQVDCPNTSTGEDDRWCCKPANSTDTCSALGGTCKGRVDCSSIVYSNNNEVSCPGSEQVCCK